MEEKRFEQQEIAKHQLSLFSFGNFEVRLGEFPLTGQFRTDKERGLLTFLICEAHRPHRREILGELFWPEREEGVARTNLRQAILGLRRAIGNSSYPENIFHITNEFIQLNPGGPVWLDADAFSAHLKFAQSHPHRELEACSLCIQHLEEAVRLYRGSFLETVFVESQPFQEWMVFKREAFFRDLMSALQTLTSAYEKQADYETARTYALKHVSLYPLEERAHQQLMRLFALSDQRTAALEQYQTCKKLLFEELGVEPGAQTQLLYEQIRQGIPLAFATASSPPFSPPREKREPFTRNNLPGPLTSFIGREEEMGQLTRCLRSPVCRLTTLIGPPGVGKTRLAIQVGKENLGVFPEGVWFVPLETIQTEHELLSAIAKAIGFVSEGQFLHDALIHHLQNQKALIILDGYEHFSQKGGVLLELLGNAPALKIMVTSRERLNYQVACIFEISGLPYPTSFHADQAKNSPAVQLFLNRALHRQILGPNSPHDLKDVIEICQLLEGLPLALELAAASVHQFTCPHIIAQIQKNLDVLKTSMPDVPKRHQSMYVAIQQSWALLSEEEQTTFARLGVFQGSFSQEAAKQIAEASVSALASLTDKSLIGMDDLRRYKLPLILRNFALEKLHTNQTEATNVEKRFAHYYVSFLEQLDLAHCPYAPHQLLRELEKEIENIRAAWLWITKNQVIEGISKGIDSLWLFFNARDQLKDGENAFRLGVEALRTVSSRPDVDCLLSKALAGLGWFLSRQGEYDDAKNYYSESIACVDPNLHEDVLVFPYFGLGYVAYQFGEYQLAETNFLAAFQAGEKFGEQKWTLMAKLYLILLQFMLGKNNTPENDLSDILFRFEKTGNLQGCLRTLKQLGDVAHIRGDLSQAKYYYHRTAQLAKELEQTGTEGIISLKMGIIASEEGNYQKANELLQKAWQFFEHTGNREYLVLTLRELGGVASLENEFQMATQHFRQALSMALSTIQPPLMLEVLSGIACMLAKTQRQETAWELIGLIQSHSATHPLTCRRVKSLLSTCNQAQMSEEASIKGHSLDLLRVMAEFQISL
ncbi:MAG: hypothetical protein HUU38_17765 [Anaerolineales bacterium]|nr:hypothetical protein [Anaerolineales bacterium]